MELRITKEMSTIVTSAMYELIINKGSKRSMVYQEDVERYLLGHECSTFVPVGLTISALISARYLRYFVLDNGRRMYGFTDMAWDKMEPMIKGKKREFKPSVTFDMDMNTVRENKVAGLARARFLAEQAHDYDEVKRLDEEIMALQRILNETEETA